MVTSNTRRRVLIVDDEQIIADTLALICNKSGFQAQAVYSGEEAIKTARMLAPDVLISDVIMRGMSGIETAVQITEITPGCRVILISGQASTADLLSAAESEGHVFEILNKPLHPRILLERLGNSL